MNIVDFAITELRSLIAVAKAMARFKEQPAVCSCEGCGNQRQFYGRSMQECRHGWEN